MPEINKQYLGDGVYASFDGFQIKLYTLEGMEIYLDPQVMRSVRKYIDDLLKQDAPEAREGEEVHA